MSSQQPMPILEVDAISAGYGKEVVIESLSFAVEQGQIVSLLGPSGCGKTTALRAVAGFEDILSGRITIAGSVVSTPGKTVPPEKRAIGMVFQDYALFPHLNIADNIAFGLRGRPKAERRAQVDHLLEATGLVGMAHRYPHELSGGQQQRVALARALAPRPSLLLLDEPFSNLDVELRERLSIEVRDLLKAEGISGILVTHDQHEAFAVSDAVGIMHQGRILQWDTPHALYHRPRHRFVADFIGHGRFIGGVIRSGGSCDSELGPLPARCAGHLAEGSRVEILIRPGDILPDADGEIAATVKDKAFKGDETLYLLELSTGTRLLSLFPSHHDHNTGDAVRVRLHAEHLICFPVADTPGHSSTESFQ
jgi:iron(III) transport system ATP-binding protein